MPLSGQTTYGTFFGDIADVELLAYRSSGPTRNDVRARGELLYRCSTPRSPVLYDLTARFDVVDLLNGVSIVSDDGLFTLEVRGRLAP
jgi:hypothetical protein